MSPISPIAIVAELFLLLLLFEVLCCWLAEPLTTNGMSFAEEIKAQLEEAGAEVELK